MKKVGGFGVGYILGMGTGLFSTAMLAAGFILGIAAGIEHMEKKAKEASKA